MLSKDLHVTSPMSWSFQRIIQIKENDNYQVPWKDRDIVSIWKIRMAPT